MATSKITGRHWYVAVSGHGQALQVQDELRAAGYEAYVPIERVTRTRARKRVEVDAPIFGPYLFVEVEGGDFPDARAIDGMKGYISSAKGPLAIRDEIVQDLKTAETRGLFDWTKAKRKMELPLKPGDPIRVIAGPFTGFMAEVMARRGKHRVEILLSLFGKVFEINIENIDVTKVT